MIMNDKVTVVFHGFLNLTNLEKLQMVGAINEYFDSNDRGPIREECEAKFNGLDIISADKVCICCGRGCGK